MSDSEPYPLPADSHCPGSGNDALITAQRHMIATLTTELKHSNAMLEIYCAERDGLQAQLNAANEKLHNAGLMTR